MALVLVGGAGWSTVAVAAGVLCALGMGRAGAAEKVPCLAFDPTTVTIQGFLHSRHAFGPPGYGEDPKHDSVEHIYVIVLDAPICVNGDPKSDINSDSVSGVREIQVWADRQGLWQRMKSVRGKKVIARGTLETAVTAHQRTPVTLKIRSIQ